MNYSALNSLYFKVNLIFTTLLGLLFLQFNHNYGLYDFFFTFLALISTIATIYLIYYILLRVFFRFKLTSYIFMALFSLTNLILLLDFAIYRVWKFHINGMVLNIIFSPAAYDSLYMSTTAAIVIIVAVLAVISFSVFSYKKLKNLPQHQLQKQNKKFNLLLIPALFLIIVYEKLTYAFANLHADNYLLERTKVIPLYQPLTMDRFLMKHFGLKKTKTDKLNLKISKITNINYPLNPIKIENSKRPNIFIFGIDALRRQSITKEITPNIKAFADENICFCNNISGGNNTRFGMFSIFYGINSSYWFGFLNAQKGSVLFDVLKELSYNISIISSVTLEWPEFRKTIFNNVQPSIKDDFKASHTKKDKDVINYFDKWLNKQDKTKPLFSFLWLDSLHAAVYPKEHRIFTPDNAQNDYLTVNKSDKEVRYNRYKNSAHFVDALFGAFIQKLKEQNLYENSIIILLSDHGEEFYEHGFFGHNSAYDEYQVGSPLIFHIPAKESQKIIHMTSHLDIIPTLMKQLGVTNPTSDYAHGDDLFAPNYKRECSFIGNWNENALVCKNYTIAISNIVSRTLNNKVRETSTYKELQEYDKNYLNKEILKVLNENKQFTK